MPPAAAAAVQTHCRTDGRASSASTSENVELDVDEQQLARGARTAPFGSQVLLASAPPPPVTAADGSGGDVGGSRSGGGGGGQEQEQEQLRVTVDSKERLRWSAALHERFCQAVADLGGSPFAKVRGKRCGGLGAVCRLIVAPCLCWHFLPAHFPA